MSVEGMRLRFQPKGSMCANCGKRNTDCNDLPFVEMLPILDTYKDYSDGECIHVMIVKCSEFVRLQ